MHERLLSKMELWWESVWVKGAVIATGAVVMTSAMYLGFKSQESPAPSYVAQASPASKPATAAAPMQTAALQEPGQSDAISKFFDNLTKEDNLFIDTYLSFLCAEAKATERKARAQESKDGESTAANEPDTAMQDVCADVPVMSEEKILATMQDAANRGQKDAQWFIERKKIEAAGLLDMLSDDPNAKAKAAKLSDAERQKLIEPMKALALAGHREAMHLLNDVYNQLPEGQNPDPVFSHALKLIADRDWTKPLPTSTSDEAYEDVPEAMRAQVMQRSGELYAQCCRNPNQRVSVLDLGGVDVAAAAVETDTSSNASLDAIQVDSIFTTRR